VGNEVQIRPNNENHKFGWSHGSAELLCEEEEVRLQGPANHPNWLVLPFSVELIRTTA